MDLFEVSPICKTVKDDFEPQARTLAELAEMLEIAYKLLRHPILQDWKEFEKMDVFPQVMKNPAYYELFNPTLIERTIHECRYYHRVEILPGKIMTVSSEGYERALASLETFILAAKKIYYSSEVEFKEHWTGIHLFRLQQGGALTGTLQYLLSSCLSMVLIVRKHAIQISLNRLSSDGDKKVYLLRTRTDLMQAKNETYKKNFEELTAFIDLELEFLQQKHTTENDESHLADLVNTYMEQQKARISKDQLLNDLVNGDIDAFGERLQQMILQVFSFHDVAGKQAEIVYHTILLNLLMPLQPTYRLLSNRESGLGRYDIAAIPSTTQQKGIIIEVKKADTTEPQKIGELLSEALQQIKNNKYCTDLELAGIKEYIAISIVFSGKEVFLKHEYLRTNS